MLNIAFSGFGQAPGYMGKRLIVNADYFCMPAFMTTVIPEDIDFSIKNKSFGFGIDYAVDRVKTAGLDIQFFKTSTNLTANFSFEEDNLNPEDLNIDINGKIYSINYKFFQNKNVAPVGFYLKTEVGLMRFSINYNRAIYMFNVKNNHNGPITVIPELENKKNYNIICLAATIGKQRIIFDRLVINYGVRFGMAVGLQSSFLRQGYIPSILIYGNRINEKNYLISYAQDHLWAQYAYKVSFGLGYLIF